MRSSIASEMLVTATPSVSAEKVRLQEGKRHAKGCDSLHMTITRYPTLYEVCYPAIFVLPEHKLVRYATENTAGLHSVQCDALFTSESSTVAQLMSPCSHQKRPQI